MIIFPNCSIDWLPKKQLKTRGPSGFDVSWKVSPLHLHHAQDLFLVNCPSTVLPEKPIAAVTLDQTSTIHRADTMCRMQTLPQIPPPIHNKQIPLVTRCDSLVTETVAVCNTCCLKELPKFCFLSQSSLTARCS